MVSDEKMNFQGHIKETISKARRGIGLIRYQSKYVLRHVSDQIYRLYVRPQLDFGDIVYNRHDPNMKLDFTRRIEQIQYKAVHAVIGTY